MEVFPGADKYFEMFHVSLFVTRYFIVVFYIIGSLHVLRSVGDRSLLVSIKKTLFYWIGTIPLLGLVFYPYTEGFEGWFNDSEGISGFTEHWYPGGIFLMLFVIFSAFIVRRDQWGKCDALSDELDHE